MAHSDITFVPDPDPESISSDVAGFGGLLVTTQIPTHADGSLELGSSSGGIRVLAVEQILRLARILFHVI